MCREYPVIWLSAPAGSGKTTLIASYLTERKLKSLWYQVDEGDSDMATFFYYMRLAATKASPRKRTLLPLLTPEYSLGIPTFILRYFENLYSRLKAPFVIVFDNYQLVPGDSSFHALICQGLAIIPEGVNVIVLSRFDPPTQFVRLQANDQIHLIEADRINFTLDESRRFVSLRGFEGFPNNLLAQLHEITQGWAAGLVLLLESARIKGIDGGLLSTSVSEQVFAYFAQEIFEHADRATREFLLKTAFLPKMTASMAERLTGSARSREVLSRLSRDHFFTQRDNQSNPFYQYHPLFREFLLSEARSRMSDEEISTLQISAAKVLEDEGQIEDAADLLLSVSEWDEMTRFLLAHAPALISQGRNSVVDGWFNRFPQESINRSAWLLYWKGMTRVFQDPDEAQGFFERAFALFTSQGDQLGEILACCGVMKSISTRHDDFSSLSPWIKRLESRMKGDLSFLLPELEASIAGDMTIALCWLHPYRFTDIKNWLERSLRLARKVGDINQQFIILTCAVIYYSVMGDLENLALFSPKAEDLALLPALSPVSLVNWKAGEAYMKWGLKMGHEEVLKSLSEALEIGRRTGIRIFDEFILQFAVRYSFMMGDLTRTAELLPQLEQAMRPGSRRAITLYQSFSAWYHFLKGDTSRAIQIVRKMSEGLHVGNVDNQITVACIQAQILYAYGERDEAFRKLSIYKKLVAKFGDRSSYGTIYNLCEAQFLLDAGEEEKGLKSLAQAMAVAKEQGYVIAPFHLPRLVLTGLCMKALKHGIEVEYAQHLIRNLGLFPETLPLEIPNWPWPIRIFTLGKFEVLVNDRPIEMTRFQKKPLLLLKALIALGGEGVRSETLSELLWPDAEGDAAHIAFKTTLFRLRRLIGNDRAIMFHEGRMSLDTRSAWVDTWAFGQVLTRAESKKEDASFLAAEAMNLYQGSFLPFEDEHWMISLRERLRDRFLRLIVMLGSELEEKGQWDEACTCYRAALDVDDLSEQFYQRLMICHAQLGDKAAASSVYTRLCTVLKAHLGTEPSPKTEAIYRQVRS